MTPKEKAEQLADYYMPFCSNNYNDAKQCALIAVDEVMKSNEDWDLEQNIWCDTGFFGDCQMYWIAVKQEIEKL